jgi:hypothetical protein
LPAKGNTKLPSAQQLPKRCFCFSWIEPHVPCPSPQLERTRR